MPPLIPAPASQMLKPKGLWSPVGHPSPGASSTRFQNARLTKKRASLKLPYPALRSPVEIRVRCHRFGLEGTVSLSVNG